MYNKTRVRNRPHNNRGRTKKRIRNKHSKRIQKHSYSLKKKVIKKKTMKGGNIKGGTSDSFHHMRCSPLSHEYKHGNPTDTHLSCLPNRDIELIKKYWNIEYPNDKITETNPYHIWSEIQNKLENKCHNDYCILKQPFITKHMKKSKHNKLLHSEFGGTHTTDDLTNYYAPKMPEEWKKNPDEWLSSIEIIEKMKQYEDAYKCFEFIGPVPIDFDTVLEDNTCVDNEMCKFQLSDYIHNNTKKIGIIFNTDPHDKSGKHWISLFINIPKKKVFFFDSAGDKAPKQIMNFFYRIKNQGLALSTPIEFTFDQNHPNVHQQSTSECGMYSLFFIINMLEDRLTENYLKTHIIPDSQMKEYRTQYFNNI